MDVLANACTLDSMAVSDPTELGTASGEPGVGFSDSSAQKAAGTDFVVDKENEGNERGGTEARSGALQAMDIDMVPRNEASQLGTHLFSGGTVPPSSQTGTAAGRLTKDSVLQRTAELFPGGTTAPAVQPRQPPIVQTPTGLLASLAFDASKGVELWVCEFTVNGKNVFTFT